ncbi:STAS domain-containing protein [Cellvibrio sp. OA-2007]|uniref:STAS domain-containing protein n=1 Tax=Cellvibrio sp. OA-2007 TaxID=529823 RepID=UPI0007866C29|nr:STAS domain-containing protein [Cellvibrio sp. OA-2007]
MSGSTVIKMPKRFDYSSSATFNRDVLSALECAGTVTLDCAEMEYIDSAGIGLLVMSQKKAQSRESKIVMTNLLSAPKEILQLANLQKIIEMS